MLDRHHASRDWIIKINFKGPKMDSGQRTCFTEKGERKTRQGKSWDLICQWFHDIFTTGSLLNSAYTVLSSLIDGIMLLKKNYTISACMCCHTRHGCTSESMKQQVVVSLGVTCQSISKCDIHKSQHEFSSICFTHIINLAKKEGNARNLKLAWGLIKSDKTKCDKVQWKKTSTDEITWNKLECWIFLMFSTIFNCLRLGWSSFNYVLLYLLLQHFNGTQLENQHHQLFVLVYFCFCLADFLKIGLKCSYIWMETHWIFWQLHQTVGSHCS